MRARNNTPSCHVVRRIVTTAGGADFTPFCTATIGPQRCGRNVGQRVGQHGGRPVVGGYRQSAVKAPDNRGPGCVGRIPPAGDVEGAKNSAGDGHRGGVTADGGQQRASEQQLLCKSGVSRATYTMQAPAPPFHNAPR